MRRTTWQGFAVGVVMLLAACGSPKVTYIYAAPLNDAGTPTDIPTDDAGAPEPVRAPELGTGDHTAGSVTFTEIAIARDGLKTPRDLAFNSRRADELWVLNYGDESVTIVHDASADEQRKSEWRKDGYALHFMANPAALAFGGDETTFGIKGTFATCGESRNTYDDQTMANDFMGPALWSSDLTIFAKKNPNGLGSHLDMLHNTPLCMGITHEAANRYWVFGGKRGSIDRYDFKIDDGIGQDDHSDGESYHYAAGQMKYVKGVPSHLVYRAEDAMVYVADTGHSRIVKLDTTSGKRGAAIPPKEAMGTAVLMDDAVVTEVVPSSAGLLKRPSGLEIHGDFLYVSDNATSVITAFTLEGEMVNYLETGLPAGALSGMAFGPDGKLYFVDMLGHRVLRIDVP